MTEWLYKPLKKLESKSWNFLDEYRESERYVVLVHMNEI